MDLMVTTSKSDSFMGEPPVLRTIGEIVSFLDRAQRVTESPVPMFMRICGGPMTDRLAGPSWDAEASVQLPGWSVSKISPEQWWRSRRSEDWVARRLAQHHSRVSDSRGGWLVTGQPAGFGPDHEPLLVHLNYWAQIESSAFEDGLEMYRSRFNVSRDRD